MRLWIAAGFVCSFLRPTYESNVYYAVSRRPTDTFHPHEWTWFAPRRMSSPIKEKMWASWSVPFRPEGTRYCFQHKALTVWVDISFLSESLISIRREPTELVGKQTPALTLSPSFRPLLVWTNRLNHLLRESTSGHSISILILFLEEPEQTFQSGLGLPQHRSQRPVACTDLQTDFSGDMERHVDTTEKFEQDIL